jgi:FkbM family methyltransferase
MGKLTRYVTIALNEGFREANIRVLEHLFGSNSKVTLYFRGYKFNQDKDGDSYIINNNTENKVYLADETVLTEFFDETRNKLYYDKMLNLNEDDKVLNIGAHIGTTVTYPAERCKKVYAVEPNPETIRILKKNVRNYTNVEIIRAGCWRKTEKLELKFGKNKNDDSFLTPDDGGSGGSTIVQAYTIDDLINKIDDKITFLKVEAEGAELEVLEGMSQHQINKVVVKVDEERDGESPIVDVIRMLDGMGYEIDCKYPYVYGRKS